MTAVGIQLIGLAAGGVSPVDGQWVVEYDPLRPGANGWRVHLVCSPDQADARRFADAKAAHEAWTASTGRTLPGGKPDRPLTAFTVAFERLPELAEPPAAEPEPEDAPEGHVVDAKWLVGPVSRAVLASVNNRADEAVEIVDYIGRHGGPPAMFAACCAWADAVGEMSGVREQLADGGFIGVTVEAHIDLDDRENKGRLFANRFVAAVLNGDDDMAAALFNAPIEGNDPEAHGAGIFALLGLVGMAGRARLAERNAKMRRRPAVQRPPRQGRGQR